MSGQHCTVCAVDHGQVYDPPIPCEVCEAYAQAEEYYEPQIAALTAERDRLLDLIEALADPDPCRLDHHGGCQAHGYLSLEPGEVCPVEQAKRILAIRAGGGDDGY